MKNLGTVVSFDATSGRGTLDLDNGSSLNFDQEDIGLNIRGSLIVSKDVIVYHEKSKIINIIPKNHMQYNNPDDFVERKNIIPTKTASSSSGSDNNKEKGIMIEKTLKKYFFYLAILIIVVGYWVSKGTPSPMLFFTSSIAKEECLNLANKNKGKTLLGLSGDVRADDTWLKDGKRVVRLLQKNGDDMSQIMCIYGNGMVEIPSLIEQGRWR